MKHLTATFEIENDFAEHKLRTTLEGMNVKYINTLADVGHIKNNTTYKKLIKAKKESQLNLDRYINQNR